MKKAYPRYRELPFPWPNQIPVDWVLAKIASVFTERKETVSDKDFEPLSVTKEGIVPQLDTAAKTDNGDNRKKVLVGDFVINSRSDRKGSSGLSKYDGSVSVINTVLQPLQDKVGGKYIEYLLKNYFFQEEFYRYGKGIVDDLWSTKYSNMKGIPIPLPPLPEQRQIAAFLDHKCALIDTFIQKKTRLIELLKEQKQAIINKAVTKGIDPNVRLKPSGVEWLGDIPEGWEVKKLKYLCSVISKGTTPSTEGKDFASSGIRFLKGENIFEGEINLQPEFFIDNETHEALKRSQLRENDILIVIAGATIGKIGIVTKEILPANTNQAVCFLRLRDVKNLEYLHLLLQSDFIQRLVRFEAVQAAQPNLAMGVLGNFCIPIAPYEVQIVIVKSIASEIELTHSTINKVQKELTLLQEYKTTLIAEAVTGKIDVRDWRPKAAELTDKTTVAYE